MGFLLAQKYLFVTSGLQNIHLDIDIQNICGLQTDIKVKTLTTCTMTTTEVSTMSVSLLD